MVSKELEIRVVNNTNETVNLPPPLSHINGKETLERTVLGQISKEFLNAFPWDKCNLLVDGEVIIPPMEINRE